MSTATRATPPANTPERTIQGENRACPRACSLVKCTDPFFRTLFRTRTFVAILLLGCLSGCGVSGDSRSNESLDKHLADVKRISIDDGFATVYVKEPSTIKVDVEEDALGGKRDTTVVKGEGVSMYLQTASNQTFESYFSTYYGDSFEENIDADVDGAIELLRVIKGMTDQSLVAWIFNPKPGESDTHEETYLREMFYRAGHGEEWQGKIEYGQFDIEIGNQGVSPSGSLIWYSLPHKPTSRNAHKYTFIVFGFIDEKIVLDGLVYLNKDYFDGLNADQAIGILFGQENEEIRARERQ